MPQLLDQFGNVLRTDAPAKARGGVRPIRARYDAAQNTEDNKNHWAAADGLSADWANSPEVRRRLRDRARYEVANNSYAKGIVLTLANDSVGTGPRLQIQTQDQNVNRSIEAAWKRWSDSIRLAEKLRTMRMSRATDGEAVGLLKNNPRLPTPVKLDLQLIEAEQLTTPDLAWFDPYATDGIRFDADNVTPIEYHVLRWHPGSRLGYLQEYDRISPDMIIHVFRSDRPGQTRGIPEITPALPLFAQLRRFTLAVIAAAETAAEFAGVLYTDSPAIESPDDVDVLDTIQLVKRAMLTLPAGWKLGQVTAEQPTTTYGMFKGEILNEIARCLNMPFNIAAGNSSGYNYSSGRLDHQIYFKSIEIDHHLVERLVLDRLLAAWFDEAALIPGALPDGLGLIDEIPHEWFWDAAEDIDPGKTSSAIAAMLRIGMTSYPTEFAQRGQDWETEQAKQAQALGLTIEQYRAHLVGELFKSQPAQQQMQPQEASNAQA